MCQKPHYDSASPSQFLVAAVTAIAEMRAAAFVQPVRDGALKCSPPKISVPWFRRPTSQFVILLAGTFLLSRSISARYLSETSPPAHHAEPNLCLFISGTRNAEGIPPRQINIQSISKDKTKRLVRFWSSMAFSVVAVLSTVDRTLGFLSSQESEWRRGPNALARRRLEKSRGRIVSLAGNSEKVRATYMTLSHGGQLVLYLVASYDEIDSGRQREWFEREKVTEEMARVTKRRGPGEGHGGDNHHQRE